MTFPSSDPNRTTDPSANQYPQAPHQAQYGQASQPAQYGQSAQYGQLAGYSPTGYPQAGYGVEPQTTRGTVSLIFGILSLLLGWSFFAPIIGIIFGVQSLKHEPLATTRAKWGIALNALCFLAWILLVIVIMMMFGLGIFASFSGS